MVLGNDRDDDFVTGAELRIVCSQPQHVRSRLTEGRTGDGRIGVRKGHDTRTADFGPYARQVAAGRQSVVADTAVKTCYVR